MHDNAQKNPVVEISMHAYSPISTVLKVLYLVCNLLVNKGIYNVEQLPSNLLRFLSEKAEVASGIVFGL